jgi:hypothetical protein
MAVIAYCGKLYAFATGNQHPLFTPFFIYLFILLIHFLISLFYFILSIGLMFVMRT